MAFMLVGAALTLLILPPNKIIRDDGSMATNFTFSSVTKEGKEILKLFINWKMLLVLPAAWTSNFFYTYQFNNVNGVLFTLRTQGFNNIFYWSARMMGSTGIGCFLDFGFASCRKRGITGVLVVFVLGTAIWGGGLANQLRYVGFYNGVQSAGAAVAWQLDMHKTPLITQLIVNWALMMVSCPLLVLLLFLAVKD
nr:unnamed protein product [Digitaria exilis]